MQHLVPNVIHFHRNRYYKIKIAWEIVRLDLLQSTRDPTKLLNVLPVRLHAQHVKRDFLKNVLLALPVLNNFYLGANVYHSVHQELQQI